MILLVFYRLEIKSVNWNKFKFYIKEKENFVSVVRNPHGFVSDNRGVYRPTDAEIKAKAQLSRKTPNLQQERGDEIDEADRAIIESYRNRSVELKKEEAELKQKLKMMNTSAFLNKTKVVELESLYNSSVNGAPDQPLNDGLCSKYFFNIN